MSAADWLEANQRVLVAEFTRLKARLAGAPTTACDAELQQARAALTAPAAIDVIVDTLALTTFERDVLLLAAGMELDSALAAQCAASDQGGSPYPTFGLALVRLEAPHWSALAPVRPLRFWRLIEVRDERALTTSRLSIDERVLHYLAGMNYLDPRLRPFVRAHTRTGLLAPSQLAVASAAGEALFSPDATGEIIQLVGDDTTAQLEIARRVAEGQGLSLFVLRSGDIPPAAGEADALALLWSRESVLLRTALLVRAEEQEHSLLSRFVQRLGGLVLIAGKQAQALDRTETTFIVDRPTLSEQAHLWNEALGDDAERLQPRTDAIATQFRLGTDAIERTARTLVAFPPGTPDDELDLLLARTCRESVRKRLDDLAQRVEPTATWSDLVLPEAQMATLRQIGAHVRHRLRVYEEWGFAGKSARGLGISVLFTGESGTGKTMAAEVLANHLGLDLYRIDLASMVSKYVGETEKNLRRVFDAAEDSGAILLFDEADALFGKRSEVKDSHDRYANIEVSYLLQRMEAYRGLAILTTNLKGSLDVAFQRRLRFVVPFPFPDAAQRERIWRGVFPTHTPLAGVDLGKLSQLNVAGGHIRNIALNAAFIAAEAKSAVGMSHLLQAARSEAAKRERPYSEAEMRGWA
jgi:ATPase family associated with various cellular activities (AAA)/Winged helix domain, variant